MTKSGEEETESLYTTLQVDKAASPGELKKAYRSLALRLHPDKNAGDTAAAAQFKSVTAAYNVLGDANKRAYYDRTGSAEDVDIAAEEWMQEFVTVIHGFTGGQSLSVRSQDPSSRFSAATKCSLSDD